MPTSEVRHPAPAADRVLVFDTTLRDGEQAPGCSLTPQQKVAVARRLACLGVDVIEAGFPAASPGDWDAVRAVARAVGSADGPVICGLARATRSDVDRCWAAVADAARPRIHTFIATSDLHLAHKLHRTRAEVLATVAEIVAHARALCADVEFSAEDATRSDAAFLHEVFRVAIDAGATTINVPDTVGYATPDEYRALVAGIRAGVAGADRVVISTHCHDDLGLAVANSLAGVQGGARQVECTVNGLGERAGNAALEEVVVAIRTRADALRVDTGVDAREIARTSRLVAACTGVRVPPNKAVVGANAFAHEAGIHQAGVLEHRGTYEIIAAESVGTRGGVMVMGKHSGRHAFRVAVREAGYAVAEEAIDGLFERFKVHADHARPGAGGVAAFLARELHGGGAPATAYRLDGVRVVCGSDARPTATVRVSTGDGARRTASATGDGPLDAVARALDDATGVPTRVAELTVDAVASPGGVVTEVVVRLEPAGARPDGGDAADDEGGETPMATGYGSHADVTVATAEACVAALNRLLACGVVTAAVAQLPSPREHAHAGGVA